MSNYDSNPAKCRVDFFKPSGKWYTTETVTFRTADYNDFNIHAALENAIKDAGLVRYLDQFRAICLEPYVEHPFPVMVGLE